MKKSDYLIKIKPIEIDRERTRVYYQCLYERIDKDDDYELWLEFCRNLSDDEKTFFESLEINPQACMPFATVKNGYVHFECSFAVVASKPDNEDLKFSVERLEISISRHDDLDEDMLYVTVRCSQKQNSKRKGVIANIAYLKAKKQTEYKIRIDIQKKLFDMLKAKGMQFVPLSSSETQTYKQVWCEIFCMKKYSKSAVKKFFEAKNHSITTGVAGDMEFTKIPKKGVNVLVPDVDVSVKVINCARLKLEDLRNFPDIIITADDFSYTYYSKADGTSYFYKKSGG